MTEAEWLASAQPEAMLEFLRVKASNRKLRLFACACCRQVSHLLVSQALDALDTAEKVADGIADASERKRAREAAFHAGWVSDLSTRHRRGPAKACVCSALARRPYEAATEAARAARHIGVLSKTDWDSSALDVSGGVRRIVDWSSGVREQESLQAKLLIEVFGNPFRPSPPLALAVLAWNDGTVRRIAEGIYEERAFNRLPILADALLDAGCDDEELIAHCRDEGPHVRGCWALDVILGKS